MRGTADVWGVETVRLCLNLCLCDAGDTLGNCVLGVGVSSFVDWAGNTDFCETWMFVSTNARCNNNKMRLTCSNKGGIVELDAVLYGCSACLASFNIVIRRTPI